VEPYKFKQRAAIPRPSASSCYHNRCFHDGVGSTPQQAQHTGSMGQSAKTTSHKSFGTASGVSSIKSISTTGSPQTHPCQNRQHDN
ncbi:hypothetical protein NDU88_006687, partial [Pleurodeles waltl]